MPMIEDIGSFLPFAEEKVDSLADGAPVGSPSSSPAIVVRQRFPETFIFNETVIG